MEILTSALIGQLLDALVPILLTAIAAQLARLYPWLREKWGVEIEQKHRDALNEAILSGIESAIRRSIPEAQVGRVALDYVRRSVPDAIRRLGATDDILADKIEALRSRAKKLQ